MTNIEITSKTIQELIKSDGIEVAVRCFLKALDIASDNSDITFNLTYSNKLKLYEFILKNIYTNQEITVYNSLKD